MKIKYIITLIIFSLFIFGCGQKNNSKIKVGVNLPLTGNLSFYGNQVKDALMIAVEQNQNKNIEFQFEDNQSNPTNSVTVFNKFALDNNMPIIISCNSPLSIPLRPLAKKNKKVLLALVTGARDFGALNIWSFRDAINQDQEGSALANYLIDKTNKRIGVTFVVNDDYGLGGAEAFTKKFQELGGKVVAQETFSMDERNMRSKIIKLLNNKPEFVFLVGREQTIITSINQIRERDKNILIITSDSFDSPNIIRRLGENSKGIVFASYYDNLNNDIAKRFIREFQNKYNNKPGIYAYDAFVAGNYLIKLISQVGSDSNKLRDSLSTMVYYSAIKGKLVVNSKRDIVSHISIFRIDNNLQKQTIYTY